MRWTALWNRAAGRSRAARLRPALEAELTRQGVELVVPADVVATRDAARAAFARGDGVVVCGGDGTVALVAGVAAEQRGAVAVVPMGTGNDFARQLGLDVRRPLDALGVLASGRLADCDLGRATAADGTSGWFTTVANTGFDAAANRWANEVRWVRGAAVYVVSVLRTLVTYRPVPLTVTVDGGVWTGDAWLAAVGNTAYYAGGMMIAPGARVDDGLLDVCVVARPIGRAEFLARFPRVFRGTHTTVRGVRTWRGRVVELSAAGAAAELWASGERVGPLPARVEVVPAALRVLVPAGSPL